MSPGQTKGMCRRDPPEVGQGCRPKAVVRSEKGWHRGVPYAPVACCPPGLRKGQNFFQPLATVDPKCSHRGNPPIWLEDPRPSPQFLRFNGPFHGKGPVLNPTRNFRPTLGPVIVTAAVYRGFNARASPHG